MATVEECKRELKKAIERLDEISVARVEAKATFTSPALMIRG